ncbi:hypothetical protein MLD38_007777 [Melastoma candidum]|uniref:Uncharacterized protein n=1 Tax=Melastoma candidum TaxID=119954 RepID=A0ACB9RS57_9MYRT|nr:hypothetical protein MLD38_007777 [Melastoma candidum]
MSKRTVLRVDISCDKCKKKLLKAVSSLEGVDKIEVDPEKGTLTVTGAADPYDVILQARKASSRNYADIVSIGPPPKPEPPKKPEEKKPENKKPEENKPEPRIQYHPVQYHAYGGHSPYGYAVGPQMAYCHVPAPAVEWEEPSPSCSIM